MHMKILNILQWPELYIAYLGTYRALVKSVQLSDIILY